MTLTPHVLALLAATTGVGMLMACAGIQKSMLEWKRRQRLCPSCGHLIQGRACTRHLAP